MCELFGRMPLCINGRVFVEVNKRALFPRPDATPPALCAEEGVAILGVSEA